MAMGTHDTGRPRTPDDDMAMRGEVPPGWVRLPSGGIVPPVLAGRMAGWQADRDTVNTAEVIRARAAMVDAVTAYQGAHAAMMAEGADMAAAMVDVIAKADTMAKAWHRFAEATGVDA